MAGRWMTLMAAAALGALALADTAAAAGPPSYGDAWNWRLPPRKFGAMSQAERVQYTRAETLMAEGKFEAAALEFEKFMTENAKSAGYAQALLMQAYGYQLAAKRNKAVGLYNEVLDFFAGSVDEAAPALFLKGQTQIENGNLELAKAAWSEFLERDDYLQHSVADLALMKLGDQLLSEGDAKKAERAWLRVIDAMEGAFMRPDDAAKSARLKLIDLYVRESRYPAIAELLAKRIGESEEGAERKPAQEAVLVYERAMAQYAGLEQKPKEAFLEWFRGRRATFDEAGDLAGYQNRVLNAAFQTGARRDWEDLAKGALTEGSGIVEKADWLAARFSDPTRAGWKTDAQWKAFGEALKAGAAPLKPDQQVSVYAKVLDQLRYQMEAMSPASEVRDVIIARSLELLVGMANPERDRGLVGLIERMRAAKLSARAFEVARRIEDPALAKWKEIELLGDVGKFVEMAAGCEELEQTENKDYATRALRTRAYLYKDKLARYEDAIRLFAMLNDPPATVWATIECYERMSKWESAIDSCTELENFFPNDAPQAGLRKALIWQRAGNKDKTIAELRAVLKKYPRHQVSSESHQMLEKYGIKTGGGVMDVEE